MLVRVAASGGVQIGSIVLGFGRVFEVDEHAEPFVSQLAAGQLVATDEDPDEPLLGMCCGSF